MPGGDQTGPKKMGRTTGRGAGYRAAFATPEYANPVGLGCGFGGGRGLRKMFYAAGLPGWTRFGQPAYAGVYGSSAKEKELLGRQAEFLEDQLRQIKKRLLYFKEDAE